jgi:predicted amidohydrolase
MPDTLANRRVKFRCGWLVAIWMAAGVSHAAPPQRVTLAQIFVTESVSDNMARIRAAFAVAARDRAEWTLFPEASLSGYYNGFEQQEVADGFAEICKLCSQNAVTAVVGTCWKEDGKTYNELRIVNSQGDLVGRYAKRCLTYSDAEQFAAGQGPLVHTVNGMICGTLICNDLWVTPGFTDGPNPHLSLQQAKDGAQVIFQAVNSGADQRYRHYHESNLKLRAAEAKCPIVVVNAARDEAINCASGVVSGFEYLVELPRTGEVIRTVEFTPSSNSASKEQ